MNARRLMQGLSYLGDVTGKRQTYHVFRATDAFLVASFSRTKRRAGYFNVVPAADVERARSRFAGKRGVTAKDVARRTGRRPNALVALNVLYVLVALDAARIDTRRQGPKLYFNVLRG